MKQVHLIVLIFILFLYSACNKDDEEVVRILEVNQELFSVGNQEQQLTMEINSNGEWSLSSKAVWCEIATEHGSGPARILIGVKANTTEKVREGKIVLSQNEVRREITVSQAALSVVLDTASLEFQPEGGEFDVRVYTNTSWKIDVQADWVHVTPETGKDSGSFKISVDPTQAVKLREIDVYVKAGQVVKKVHIVQAGIKGEWHSEGEVKLFREEDKGNPVKLVFMGDGFIEEDMLVGGAYDQAMQEAINAFFDIEPYRTYRNYFCPYIVYAISEERGMSTRGGDDKIKVTKKTAFSADLKENTTLMNGNLNKIVEYAKKVPGLVTTKTSIVVAVNDARYAGTCYHWGNGQTVSLVPMNRDLNPPGGFDHLIVHEGAGHGFGRLADEYTGNNQIPADKIAALEQDHIKGQFLNVSTSQDPSVVYWHDFIGRQGYDPVSFFEGAHTYGKGVWRCEEKSCMINNIFYFNVACRLAVVKRIKDIAGEAFDLDDFINKDVQKAPTSIQLGGGRAYTPYYYPAPTSPIFVKE